MRFLFLLACYFLSFRNNDGVTVWRKRVLGTRARARENGKGRGIREKKRVPRHQPLGLVYTGRKAERRAGEERKKIRIKRRMRLFFFTSLSFFPFFSFFFSSPSSFDLVAIGGCLVGWLGLLFDALFVNQSIKNSLG